MVDPETLAQAVLATKPLFTRYLSGFSEENRTRQAPGLPNHAAWILGHCALTMHRAIERATGEPIPEGDFRTGDGTSGDAQRFDTESVCFGSTPLDEPGRYPSLQRAREIFESACERLAGTARAADQATLERNVVWGNGNLPFWTLVLRVGFHNGMHGGQLTDLRRVLGMGRVVG